MGGGLFDYNRFLAGAEIIRSIGNTEVSFALDYTAVRFPNYKSLVYESAYKTSMDTATYTEISKNAGKNILDYNNVALTFEISASPGGLLLSGLYRLDFKNFLDQTIVQDDGSFSSDKRRDIINSFNLNLLHRARRAEVSLENRLIINSSNQNSFDANTTKYQKDFYSYLNLGFRPAFSLYIGPPENISRIQLWLALDIMLYSNRLAQDARANHLDKNVRQDTGAIGISYTYPLTETIAVFMNASRSTTRSNMKYEGSYSYNYTSSNYFTGLNWQFGSR